VGGRRETERWIEILNSAWNEEDTARVLKRDALSFPRVAGQRIYRDPL